METTIDAPTTLEQRTTTSWWTGRRVTSAIALTFITLIVLVSVLSMQCHWSSFGAYGLTCD